MSPAYHSVATYRLGSIRFVGHNGLVTSRKQAYTVEELADLASGLRRLLNSIKDGDLKADTGTITRLEGAESAIRALAEGRNP
jgi:hypothetical protein